MFLFAKHVQFHGVQKEAMKLIEPLNLSLNKVLYRAIRMDPGIKFVSPYVKRFYLNVIQCSVMIIEAALVEWSIKTIRLLFQDIVH